MSDSLDAAARSLRAHGLRVSAARRLVLAALTAADRPLSVQDIAGGLGGRLPRSDVASVYRNLETLERAGLTRHLHPGRGAVLYELTGRRQGAYLVCDRCSAISAADPQAIADVAVQVRARLGFEPRFGEFPIVGLCPSCTAATTARARNGVISYDPGGWRGQHGHTDERSDEL
jgi:Fur family ferric uptake transcriptional regulator